MRKKRFFCGIAVIIILLLSAYFLLTPLVVRNLINKNIYLIKDFAQNSPLKMENFSYQNNATFSTVKIDFAGEKEINAIIRYEFFDLLAGNLAQINADVFSDKLSGNVNLFSGLNLYFSPENLAELFKSKPFNLYLNQYFNKRFWQIEDFNNSFLKFENLQLAEKLKNGLIVEQILKIKNLSAQNLNFADIKITHQISPQQINFTGEFYVKNNLFNFLEEEKINVNIQHDLPANEWQNYHNYPHNFLFFIDYLQKNPTINYQISQNKNWQISGANKIKNELFLDGAILKIEKNWAKKENLLTYLHNFYEGIFLPQDGDYFHFKIKQEANKFLLLKP